MGISSVGISAMGMAGAPLDLKRIIWYAGGGAEGGAAAIFGTGGGSADCSVAGCIATRGLNCGAGVLVDDAAGRAAFFGDDTLVDLPGGTLPGRTNIGTGPGLNSVQLEAGVLLEAG